MKAFSHGRAVVRATSVSFYLVFAVFSASEMVAADLSSSGLFAEVVRGPYLQSGTRTNVLVCWSTDFEASSRVRFGLSAGDLGWAVSDSTETQTHALMLTNLAPDTRYYYAVGTTDGDLVSGPEYRFTTAPAAAKPTRIWAIGDSGSASAGHPGSQMVRDCYYSFAGQRETDVWLMLGDNAYYYGTDDEYQVAVFDTYADMLRKTVVWSTIGNHETYAPLPDGRLSYFDIFSFPTAGEAGGVASGTERYYSFDYGDIHFVCLDSELSDRQLESPMLVWLEADLSANTKTWTIVYWHSPPYTKGSHDSDNLLDNGGNMTQMRMNVVPLLESFGVDLVLSGHSHNYERSYLMNGHYGFSWDLTPEMIRDTGSGRLDETGAYRKPTSGPDANVGTVYIVAGSSGWATFQTGRHPIMYSALLEMGSLAIDVEGPRMDVKFVRETGAVDDYFSIVKGDSPGTFRLASFSVSNGILTVQWQSQPGKTYRLLSGDKAEGNVWTPYTENIMATGPRTSWSGPVPGSDRQFFRVVQVD